MKDSRLWKNKNGKMTPEHVHSLENIDTLDTYENRFISYLVTLIEQEIKDLLINVTPLVDSIEEIFEQSGISYGKTSILNSLRVQKQYILPGMNLLLKKKLMQQERYIRP